MSLSKICRAAVMDAPRQPLTIRPFATPDRVEPDGALVRINCCTICRSDLHTWLGNRPGPTPAILGHEAVGTIVALGANRHRDACDARLAVGDRVTWTLHQACGACRNCVDHQLPMKCRNLKKFGHGCCDEPPHLLGGFAEYSVIGRGTSLLRLPDNLPNIVAAPANCAAATAVSAYDALSIRPGESVLIQGAGALGVYAAAYAAYIGCRHIVVSDINEERLETVKRFGATQTVNATGLDATKFEQVIKELTNGGVDCGIEVAGAPAAVPGGLAALRTGGRYAECGCVFPNAIVQLDLSLVLRNLLTIHGVHNYDVRHLRGALDFLSATVDRYPWETLVGEQFTLDQVNEAFTAAQSDTMLRVAVMPG